MKQSIDNVISVELSSPASLIRDALLIMMYYGLYGTINPRLLYIVNEKYIQNYSRDFCKYIIISEDSFLIYRSWSPDNSGYSAKKYL